MGRRGCHSSGVRRVLYQFHNGNRVILAGEQARLAATKMDDRMTARLFLDDATLATASAVVIASGPDGIVLDRTVFYARGEGQPGDTGSLRWEAGETPITEALKGDGDAILHLPAPDAALPPVG